MRYEVIDYPGGAGVIGHGAAGHLPVEEQASQNGWLHGLLAFPEGGKP
jgi:hypothetical protein